MIIEKATMQSHFREMLTLCLAKYNYQITQETQAYLVQLLVLFGKTERVYSETPKGEQPTLFELLSQAMEAYPDEALRLYRYLGDTALYHAGLFYNENRNQGYYLAMGQQGYASAADLAKSHQIGLERVFLELSRQFDQLVDVLHLLQVEPMLQAEAELSDETILHLINIYKKTKNHQILERLQKELKSPLAQIV